MKNVLLFSLMLSAIFLLSCEKGDDTIPEFALDQADLFEADEYEVYSAILGNFDQSQLIIRQQTSVYTPPKENFELFFNLEKMSNMEAALYSIYVEENVSSYLLDEKIEVPSKETKLISTKEFAYYFDREDPYKAWELFKTKYQNAGEWFFSVNKIGFNENRL
jgi:hypothetical protein